MNEEVTFGASWPEFYKNRCGEDYLAYVKLRYAPFIGEIVRRMLPDDNVLELGCGTASITKALTDGPTPGRSCFYATDVSSDMLTLARKRLQGSGALSFKWDARKPGVPLTPNVVHSHGLLEHFSDEEIRQIIGANWASARVQVHYVPGRYPKPSFGDERLMSVEDWKKICCPDRVVTFNDGLDYALVWEWTAGRRLENHHARV